MTHGARVTSASPAGEPALSVVAPVFNEAEILAELFGRICAAARVTGLPFEVLLVDDCSEDDTPRIVAELAAGQDGAPSPLQVCRLSANRGQIGATLHGLSVARGARVLVLDGDLQDPPEVIPELVKRHAVGDVQLVFACKTRRHDPLWFRLGSAGFHLAQRLLSRHRAPRGAGSYCVMDRDLARRAARIGVRDANLSALLVALGPTLAAVPYQKAARYDGASRVGPLGLAREAMGSLMLGGAVQRALALAAVVGLLAACALAAAGQGACAGVAAVGGAAALLAAVGVARRVGRLLAGTG